MTFRDVTEQDWLRGRSFVGLEPIFANALLFVTEIMSLCLPALVNGGPLLFPDTRAYYIGGHAALDKMTSMLGSYNSGVYGDSLESTMQKARGVRSAFYSLFIYVPAVTISLWMVVLLQAMIVAFVLHVAFNSMCPGRPRWQSAVFIILLGATTTASWTASLVMPDVFTGIMVLSLIIAVVFWQSLETWLRWALFMTIAASVVMHLTNLPIALGILVVSTFITGLDLWYDRARFMMIGGALILGIGAMLTVGVVGFHQWTLAPQSPPFLLARSIEDGPGKLYLLDHCPQIRLAMCRHLDKLDISSGAFIWNKDGVYSAVSPEEEAQLRGEEKRIYLAAALEHPWLQVKTMTRNAVAQLVTFTLHEYSIPSSADYTATDMVLSQAGPEQVLWQNTLSVPVYLVVISGLAYVVYTWKNGLLSRAQRDFVTLVLATVLIEAMAGAVSEPVPRYEARVIWLIPAAALLVAIQNSQMRRP